MFQFGSRRGNEKEKSGLAQIQTHSCPDTIQQISFKFTSSKTFCLDQTNSFPFQYKALDFFIFQTKNLYFHLHHFEVVF